jgi:hypothetical protein
VVRALKGHTVVQLSNVESLEVLMGRGGMESTKNISEIITTVGEDDTATRVIIPVAHVVDFALKVHPAVLGSAVLGHLGQ